MTLDERFVQALGRNQLLILKQQQAIEELTVRLASLTEPTSAPPQFEPVDKTSKRASKILIEKE